MSKPFGKLKILAIVVVLIAGAILILPFFLNANKYKPQIEEKISGVLGRTTTIGDLKLSVFSGGIAASDIEIDEDPSYGRSPFLSAKSLRLGVELQPLIFSQTIRITGITLEKPEIMLVRSETGEWNFSSLGNKAATPQSSKAVEATLASSATNVVVGFLKIIDGRLTVARRDGASKPHIYDNVNLTVQDLSLTSEFPFTMTANLPGGGTAELKGKAGPINSEDAASTPFSATLDVARFDLVASGFIESGSGIAGLIDFNGNVVSDGKQLQSQGDAYVENLQAVKGGSPSEEPLSISYSVNHNLNSQAGILNKIVIELGKAVAQLDGSYDMSGKSTVLNTRLHGENMPVEELVAFLPAAGVTLPEGASLQGGIASIDLRSEGPVENLVTTGTVKVLNTRLTGFDLGEKMRVVAKLAGITASPDTDIERFSLDAHVTQEGIRVSNLLLVVPTLGQLSGNGIVDSSRSLDFKMLAKLVASGGVVGSLGRLTGSGGGRELTVSFFVRGTTLKPSFVPDAKGIAGGLLDNLMSGEKDDAEGSNQSPSLGDTLRNLLEKKEN